MTWLEIVLLTWGILSMAGIVCLVLFVVAVLCLPAVAQWKKEMDNESLH